MYGLAVEVERCPDGVELVDLPESVGSTGTLASSRPAMTVFRYRTERRESGRFEFVDLEKPIVLAFVNAWNDEQLCRFFARYGLMTPEPQIERKDVLISQSQFRLLLQRAGGDDATAAIEAVN